MMTVYIISSEQGIDTATLPPKEILMPLRLAAKAETGRYNSTRTNAVTRTFRIYTV
jgi:hypothetical protein